MEKTQVIAIDENTTHTMVTKEIAEDIEVIWCKETGHGTIFFGEAEIECRYTANIDLVLSGLKDSTLFEKFVTLQRIERFHRIA